MDTSFQNCPSPKDTLCVSRLTGIWNRTKICRNRSLANEVRPSHCAIGHTGDRSASIPSRTSNVRQNSPTGFRVRIGDIVSLKAAKSKGAFIPVHNKKANNRQQMAKCHSGDQKTRGIIFDTSAGRRCHASLQSPSALFAGRNSIGSGSTVSALRTLHRQ